MSYVWYFAYGSNLDPEQIVKRIGSFMEARKAELPHFKLLFRGYSVSWNGAVADIEPYENSAVYGVLYKISEEQMRVLDKFEGCPDKYQRATVKVATEKGEEVEAITYIQTRKEPIAPPSKQYLEAILRGLKAHGYPEKMAETYIKTALKSSEKQ